MWENAEDLMILMNDLYSEGKILARTVFFRNIFKISAN